VAKLSNAQWADIRKQYEVDKVSTVQLAKSFGVADTTIQRRLKREHWCREKTQERLSRQKYMPIPIAEKSNYEIPKGAGYVYVITADEFESLYKIGLAKNISKRMSMLQTSCPYELKLVHCAWFENAYRVEGAFHYLFENKNVRGEWFKLTHYDIELLRGYRG